VLTAAPKPPAAAIFSMTSSLFFSLFLTVSMRQADIASKAAFTAWRASSESPGTDIGLKLRGLSSMARLLSLPLAAPARRVQKRSPLHDSRRGGVLADREEATKGGTMRMKTMRGRLLFRPPIALHGLVAG